MALALMLVLQAAAAQSAPAPPAPAAIDFDLARYRSADTDPWSIDRRCRSTDPSTVVVCARRRGGGYPMEEMERLFAVEPLVAEVGIGGGGATARAYVESVPMNRGEVSNRVMVGIRLPF
jgi:hypothetical protein